MAVLIFKSLLLPQDSIDLFLGNYVVEETEDITRPSPLRADRDWKFYAVSSKHNAPLVCTLNVSIETSHCYEVVLFGGVLEKKRVLLFSFRFRFDHVTDLKKWILPSPTHWTFSR